MATLLQTLIIETLPEDTDSILRSFIDTLLPAIEREFAFTYAMGGDEADHYRRLVPRLGELKAKEVAQSRASKPDQSLLVHVLNALLTAWNLSKYLPQHLQLTEIEKRLLCLGMTLHDYGKHLYGQDEEVPHAYQVPEILAVCEKLGDVLGFQNFWADWKEYLLEIAYLAQNTQFNVGSNAIPANWESDEEEFTLDDRRLDCPLRHLLAFGDVAVHMNDPADVVTTTKGDRLRDHLDFLGIPKKLVYHRLRDCRGLLTNQIHNAIVSFARESDWKPILYFAQGVVYLSPKSYTSLNLEQIKQSVWNQISNFLGNKILNGDAGFKRGNVGLTMAPETQELLLSLLTPSEIIRQLPRVIAIMIGNINDPATRKRLGKLVEKGVITQPEFNNLAQYGDNRADRLAEFVLLIQGQFFKGSIDYVSKILTLLDLHNHVSVEQAKFEDGVKYGWYYTAACYIKINSELSDLDLLEKIDQLADQIVVWAEENSLLPKQSSKIEIAFGEYIDRYLEVVDCGTQNLSFNEELLRYSETKPRNKPICSLSSGEFTAESQHQSVVLFQPQLYSNKNKLGGKRFLRGISTIWFLEMLFRKILWTIQTGKTIRTGKDFENQKPVFLYIFPSYVYSPQTAAAVRSLLKRIKSISLLDICDQWLSSEIQCQCLQNLPWLVEGEPEEGRFGDKEDKYSQPDLPFMAAVLLTPKFSKPTTTEAWIEPTFFALALSALLGVKTVASSSPEPLYTSDNDFFESVILDAPAGFWTLLGLPTALRLQDLPSAINRLLVAYSLYLDIPWKDLNYIVRAIVSNVLNIFVIGNQKQRNKKASKSKASKSKTNFSLEEIQHYWHYAQLWSQGDLTMQQQLKLIESLTQQYREFYQVRHKRFFSGKSSSHELLLPLSTALDVILKNPVGVHPEDVVLQGSGQLFDVIERKRRQGDENVYRPLRTQSNKELEAIRSFMETCVYHLLGNPETKEGFCKGDRALLQENRNRIKSGAEFAYRWLTLQDKQTQAEPDQTETET